MTLPLAPKPATLLRATCALLLLLTLHTPAHAQGGCVNGGSGGCSTSSVPEVDPSLATGALTLLTGAALLLRARRSPR